MKSTAMRTDSHSGRMDALEEMGVPYFEADRLSREHRLWRIEQAIKHKAEREKRKGNLLGPSWLIRCLDEDWLPTILFTENPPMSRWGFDRRAALKLTPTNRAFLKAVDEIVGKLSFWEWQFLGEKALGL